MINIKLIRIDLQHTELIIVHVNLSQLTCTKL